MTLKYSREKPPFLLLCQTQLHFQAHFTSKTSPHLPTFLVCTSSFQTPLLPCHRHRLHSVPSARQRGPRDIRVSAQGFLSATPCFSLPSAAPSSSLFSYAPSSTGCSPFRAVSALPRSSSCSSDPVVPSSALFPPPQCFLPLLNCFYLTATNLADEFGCILWWVCYAADWNQLCPAHGSPRSLLRGHPCGLPSPPRLPRPWHLHSIHLLRSSSIHQEWFCGWLKLMEIIIGFQVR